MPFYHCELFDRLRTHSEIKCGSYGLELKKHRSEMILDSPCIFFDRLSPFFLILFYFEESLSCRVFLLNVSNFEINEFYLENIGVSRTKIPLCGGLQVSNLLDCNVWIHICV